MSLLITCPNCGPRDVTEFRYGGQVLPAIAQDGTPTGSNLPGPQRERWFHRFGCRRWLVAERNVETNQVFSTGWLTGDVTNPGGDQPS